MFYLSPSAIQEPISFGTFGRAPAACWQRGHGCGGREHGCGGKEVNNNRQNKNRQKQESSKQQSSKQESSTRIVHKNHSQSPAYVLPTRTGQVHVGRSRVVVVVGGNGGGGGGGGWSSGGGRVVVVVVVVVVVGAVVVAVVSFGSSDHRCGAHGRENATIVDDGAGFTVPQDTGTPQCFRMAANFQSDHHPPASKKFQ